MATTLFVTNDFGPRAGGIETFIIGLIERLPHGSVVVYTSAQDGAHEYDEQWFSQFGVRVVRDPGKILLPTPLVARRVGKLARELRATTACFGAAAPLGLLAPTLRRAGVVKIVALTHGHEVWWSKVFPFNVAMRRIGKTVDVITYLGEFTRSAISRALPSASQKAMVKIAPGIDVEHFSPDIDATLLRNSLGLADKAVIVSVGRLVHRKGQDRLIEALPIILSKIPNAHLLVVGQGPYLERLETLATTKGVSDHVSFIGRIHYSELPKYFRVGDVFAMPSRSRFFGLEVEGLGIVYLEASACGIPVIAGDSGGAPDAVLENVTGLVVDGTNVESIADAAISILSNPAMAKAMGIAGREWIVDSWSWQLWAKKFKNVLGI
ncbi:MAG: glycosyltransferase family 1 protein [Streptomycetaceae bacterium]|nr:MAG: glycosyltransferase family 1 protein [Streptomycetaceae bacterium]